MTAQSGSALSQGTRAIPINSYTAAQDLMLAHRRRPPRLPPSDSSAHRALARQPLDLFARQPHRHATLFAPSTAAFARFTDSPDDNRALNFMGLVSLNYIRRYLTFLHPSDTP